MSQPTCATCRFWKRLPGGPDDEHAAGECHKNAPRPSSPAAPPVRQNVAWPLLPDADWCGEHEPTRETDPRLLQTLTQAGFSNRVANCVENGLCDRGRDRWGPPATVGDLVGLTELDLIEMRNFGETSLREVRVRLNAMGLSLKVDHEPEGK